MCDVTEVLVNAKVVITLQYVRGPPQNMGFIYKKLCIYPYMIKLQLPSKYGISTLLRQYTNQDIFFHCSKKFLNLLILMPFSASALFLFHLFHISKMFPFEDFFSPRETKKVT